MPRITPEEKQQAIEILTNTPFKAGAIEAPLKFSEAEIYLVEQVNMQGFEEIVQQAQTFEVMTEVEKANFFKFVMALVVKARMIPENSAPEKKSAPPETQLPPRKPLFSPEEQDSVTILTSFRLTSEDGTPSSIRDDHLKLVKHYFPEGFANLVQEAKRFTSMTHIEKTILLATAFALIQSALRIHEEQNTQQSSS